MDSICVVKQITVISASEIYSIQIYFGNVDKQQGTGAFPEKYSLFRKNML